MQTVAVVLAAGKGTRMRSDLPKVLHLLAGKPLIEHVLRTAKSVEATRAVVVVGYAAEQVTAAVQEASARLGLPVSEATQLEQNGTGHAVLCALPALQDHEGPVLILSGDVPRIRDTTLVELLRACESSDVDLAMCTFQAQDPTGYGRILRDGEGKVLAIREHKDATEAERAVRESNAGVYCVGAGVLRELLPTLGSDNAAGEIYLTDLVAKLAQRGAVGVVDVPEWEVAGVNTPEQLAAMEAALASA